MLNLWKTIVMLTRDAQICSYKYEDRCPETVESKIEVHFQNTEEAPILKWRAYQQESEKKNGFFPFKMRKFLKQLTNIHYFT